MSKIMKTMDGNEAAAYAAYAFTEVAGIYPITPSSPMAEHIDVWSAEGKKNLFGSPVRVVEMQSEAGAAGAVHGSLQAGALTTTFTASQGLLLKIPNMYKMAGQLLPCVIHVAARSVAAQALSIFGDHQDIYATRQTGFALLCSHSVQEVMDLAGVAHLAAIKGRVPFLHFFDGFRTSHEIQKIELMDYADFDRLLDKEAVKAFKDSCLTPENPKTRGTAQNDDIYFQTRELTNRYYNALPDIVADYMKEISKITGRNYKPFVYYGDENAERVIVAMGSVTQTIEQTIDYLRRKGEKVGLLKVYLYRPFSLKHLFEVMPKGVEKIAVLDRTKEPGSIGEPLYQDIKFAFYGKKDAPLIVGGRYGLSSKDVDPSQIFAIFKNLAQKAPKDNFTVGIDDDVTHTSLPLDEKLSLSNESTTECLFYGLGADGTVGANKNSIKIIGDNTDLYAQAYFAYDSKKSGGYTRSHLRFSKKPIRSTYLVSTPHFVACSVAAYLETYDVLEGIRENGTFLLNSIWSETETIKHLPNKVKRILAEKNINFYIINATKLARDIGLGNRTNTIMQAAFFKLTQIIDFEKAKDYMKKLAYKSYHKKGDAIVEMNYKAIDIGGDGLVKVGVDKEWAKLKDEAKQETNAYKGTEFVEKIAKPMDRARGNDLPVSAFLGYEDGHFESGTTEFEKRGVGVVVPRWISKNCIQCNQCASVCPHAVIRPFLLDDAEFNAAPSGVKEHAIDAKGTKEQKLKYKIQVSPLDCTGCELCVQECPSKEKSLVMVPIEEEMDFGEQENADYLFKKVSYKDDIMGKENTKGVQFSQPLFEFHGACPGCGETPYITLVTRLFGERMIVANATGCSSIYGGSAPSTPYRKSIKSGFGPAWGNSLFEDNAEFGLGMKVATQTIREQMAAVMGENLEKVPSELAAMYKEWMDKRHDVPACVAMRDDFVKMLEKHKDKAGVKQILDLKQYITKKSHWIFGGDGWAYDIGYGGLDHVLASGENVNVLVLDTEVYSNTGGQSSKATHTGAVAQFAAAGKPIQKKDLGQIAMTYGYIFVAQVNSNANYNHLIKALIAAEAYEGPSLVICYAPCIAHGIKGGLGHSGEQGELATKCGYWPIYTFDPRLQDEGKNPLVMAGKEPDWSLYEGFLLNEVRYNSLKKSNPEHFAELFEKNKQDAQKRYRQLKRLANADFSDEAGVRHGRD